MNSHEIYDKAKEIWSPNKIDVLRSFGVELVMDKREGSCFYDLEGKKYINMHSNGGVFNLGHRNPEIKEALIKGAELVDAGNHYFPSEYKLDLTQKILDASPKTMKYVFCLSGGGEAMDSAIKASCKATGKRKIISLDCAFHGATGLSMEAGEFNIANFWNLPPDPNVNIHVPYNNLEKLEDALKGRDVAAVIIESIPATAGFPMPIENYHINVEKLAHKYGALYIADEVQTGLMRSGEMWCCCHFGATPDIIVTGKGLSGGYYPMSAVIMNEKAASWLKEDGFAHTASYSFSELGCIVASKAMEIYTRESTKQNVEMLTEVFKKGIMNIQKRNETFFTEFRQCGVIMGIKTAHPMGGAMLLQALVQNGIWAMMANFDRSTLQFKPGLLMSKDVAEEVLEKLDKSFKDVKKYL